MQEVKSTITGRDKLYSLVLPCFEKEIVSERVIQAEAFAALTLK
jgi:hypothetical protein